MKVIGKTGSGKITFVSAFIEFFIGYINGIEYLYLLSPTSDQNGWGRIRKNIICVNVLVKLLMLIIVL